nr:MAG TPA: hypothetical protein [Inoviridae sp.]
MTLAHPKTLLARVGAVFCANPCHVANVAEGKHTISFKP